MSSLASFSGLNFPAILFLFFIIFLALILLAPLHLSLNIRKRGPLLQGGYRLAWLGIPLGKNEISPQSAEDLLASIWKEEAGGEVQAKEERKSKEEGDGSEEVGRIEKRAGKWAQMVKRSEITKQEYDKKRGIMRTPKIRSLINAAPALANILLDALKSILFKKISCRLCFGLDDPAQTAIISGYLWSIASVVGPFRPKISVEPWFEGERLEGEFMAEIEVRLLHTVFALMQVMRVREIRLLFKEMLGLA